MNLGWTDMHRILESSWDRIRSTIPMPMVSTHSKNMKLSRSRSQIRRQQVKFNTTNTTNSHTAFPLLRGFSMDFPSILVVQEGIPPHHFNQERAVERQRCRTHGEPETALHGVEGRSWGCCCADLGGGWVDDDP